MNCEFLSDCIFVYTDTDISFGQDALRLARFARPSSDDIVCELGTGCGVIPLLWAAENCLPAHVVAVEREPSAAALATRSLSENGLLDRIDIVCADWNDLPATFNGQFSVVVSNPPFFKQGEGKRSPHPLRAAARTEENDNALPKLMKTAARLLSPNGRFCFCMRSARRNDVLSALFDAKLAVVEEQTLDTNGKKELTLFCTKRRNG